ncbi:MAG: radical SAM protein [Oligoflexia bacterium]|nr:radical SAM protein [Oligoflexia bacterium]
MPAPSTQDLLQREQTANRKKHWVRAVTACNSRCLFCLDADTPRNVFLPTDDVKAELRRGIDDLGADKVIISGGEATLHPDFVELVRFARQDLGYDRVQTVTNGTMLADKDFYLACREAGLGEITFSLHGHTAALHDWLTQTPGGFHKLMKAMIRARRDPRGPIVNVDVCINKQNVAVLDKIVELCLSVGVRELDLMHVIPQANAFENRDLLFYDVREHLPVLHKVFRLNRHPGVVIWTNRFPVHFLEGLEDLIQDPHKMLDEVNGRRFMVRNYLDIGKPMTCRDPGRCPHCFIEPFCTSMDRQIAWLNAERARVWQIGSVDIDNLSLPSPLPAGCTLGSRSRTWPAWDRWRTGCRRVSGSKPTSSWRRPSATGPSASAGPCAWSSRRPLSSTPGSRRPIPTSRCPATPRSASPDRPRPGCWLTATPWLATRTGCASTSPAGSTSATPWLTTCGTRPPSSTRWTCVCRSAACPPARHQERC